jgi:hypothetical protein
VVSATTDETRRMQPQIIVDYNRDTNQGARHMTDIILSDNVFDAVFVDEQPTVEFTGEFRVGDIVKITKNDPYVVSQKLMNKTFVVTKVATTHLWLFNPDRPDRLLWPLTENCEWVGHINKEVQNTNLLSA